MGYVRVRSPLLAESLLFSVPVGTEMVHFPTLSSTAYVFSGGFSRISQRGFPHSEIPGSKPICGSPGLIAAYRVLHRLLVPRHSPYTLSSLTIKNRTDAHLKAKAYRHASAICTLRVWSEKNYRLQDIQLSKNRHFKIEITKQTQTCRACKRTVSPSLSSAPLQSE